MYEKTPPPPNVTKINLTPGIQESIQHNVSLKNRNTKKRENYKPEKLMPVSGKLVESKRTGAYEFAEQHTGQEGPLV